MKSISLEPMLALFNLGGGEIVLILVVTCLSLVVLGAIVFFAIKLLKDSGVQKKTSPVPPTVPLPHSCPQCGTQLSSDAPQGLCPKCLMKVGLGSHFEPLGENVKRSSTPPPSAESIAKFFPQLEIIELLGQGGMGTVYKARQPQLDRFVALKILLPELSKDPAFAERFSREAKALAKLNHPNIVGVYDFGKAGNFFYFIMEYVDGVNLWQLEQTQKKIAPEQALVIVPKICDALQYAHEEGIVHRDIKPANILIDTKGRIKIADFGIAKLVGKANDPAGLTHSRMTIGTPHYMAPEQIEKPLDVDHRADIYSLGVVFYEMLTGELPIGRFSPPSQKVSVDVRLDEVVLRALEKEPGRRYQHVSEVKDDVQSVSGIIEQLPPNVRYAVGFEYRSKQTLFGLPLLHITSGVDPTTGKRRTAKGIIAMGEKALGVIALGGVATGVLSFGGLALGVIPFGGLGIGLLACGGLAVGLIGGYGGIVIAPIAMGGLTVGYLAFGGGAFGAHCLGGNANDPVARNFFLPWAGRLNFLMLFLMMAIVFSSSTISAIVPSVVRRRLQSGQNIPPVPKSLIWLAISGTCALLLLAGILAESLYKKLDWYGSSQKTVAKQEWEIPADAAQLPGSSRVQEDGRTVFKIENTNNAPLQLSLFKIEKPSVTSMSYAITGEIKYEHVQGDGYLEMWSYILPEGPSFTRTLGLAGSGPMGRITGTSNWRPFSLPFDRTGTTNLPTHLEINIFLPSKGVVYLSPVKLVNF